MTRGANPAIALFPEASFGTALDCVGIVRALRFRVPSRVMPYCRDDDARRAGETGVGDHIGRDAWTEGVLERAILGLSADNVPRARLRTMQPIWC